MNASIQDSATGQGLASNPVRLQEVRSPEPPDDDGTRARRPVVLTTRDSLIVSDGNGFVHIIPRVSAAAYLSAE